MSDTTPSVVDEFICGFDNALRTLTPGSQVRSRECPSASATGDDLSDRERKHAAGLMRVNHTGEVCAQALYQGQALTAKLPKVRCEMKAAAEEELDHLAWCEQRLDELESHTSLLNPLWYGLSFGLGATAGVVSDKTSLGFVAATEEQVCKHLQKHLNELPQNDSESRAIVEQMIVDEEKHAKMALDAGGYNFPQPLKMAMSLVSKLMTSTSYRV